VQSRRNASCPHAVLIISEWVWTMTETPMSQWLSSVRRSLYARLPEASMVLTADGGGHVRPATLSVVFRRSDLLRLIVARTPLSLLRSSARNQLRMLRGCRASWRACRTLICAQDADVKSRQSGFVLLRVYSFRVSLSNWPALAYRRKCARILLVLSTLYI